MTEPDEDASARRLRAVNTNHPAPDVPTNIPIDKQENLVDFLNILLWQFPSGVVYELDFDNKPAMVQGVRTDTPTMTVHIHADSTFDEDMGCYLVGKQVPSDHKENVETSLRLLLEAEGMRWSFNPDENTFVVWVIPDADATRAQRTILESLHVDCRGWTRMQAAHAIGLAAMDGKLVESIWPPSQLL